MLDGWTSREIAEGFDWGIKIGSIDSVVHRQRRKLKRRGLEAPRAMMNARPSAEIGVFTAERCLEHRVPRGFPERPERLSRIVDHLRGRGLAIADVAREARRPEGLTGAPAALDSSTTSSTSSASSARSSAATGCSTRPTTRSRRAPGRRRSPGSRPRSPPATGRWPASRPRRVRRGAAAGASRRAGDWRWGSASSTTRRSPPSACAGATARRRVAIFDFDVHHGNGTQHLFEARADVLYASTHQYPFYPGTGAADGARASARDWARRSTCRCRRERTTRSTGARSTTRSCPRSRRFGPDALVMSAGFDAYAGDPLGGMRVTAAGFREWGAILGGLADRLCEGRSLSVLEGGYDLERYRRLVEAYLDGLSGRA